VDTDGSAVGTIADFGDGSDVNWPSWSPDGSKILCTVYSSEADGAAARAHVMDADGSNLRPVPDAAGCSQLQDTPCWGPDSETVAYTTELACGELPAAAVRSAIAVVSLLGAGAEGGSSSRLLHDPLVGLRYQQWSPIVDTPRFVLELGAGGPPDIYTIDAVTAGERRPLTDGKGLELNEWPAWSRDGQQICWSRGDAATEEKELWVMQAADGSAARQLTSGVAVGDGYPSFDPCGTQVAFATVDSEGRGNDIFVVDLGGEDGGVNAGLRKIVSGGTQPSWSPF
jgi:Tol biopolymer transport system component